MEIAGKIIEMDIGKNTFINNPPVVTRFNELPVPIQETLTVMAKGVRNITGISFQRFYNQYIKYVGNVGQDLVESIFSFVHYTPIPVTKLIQASVMNTEPNQEGLLTLAGEGGKVLFLLDYKGMLYKSDLDEKSIAYYNEAIISSVRRIQPLTSYFHKDPDPISLGELHLQECKPIWGMESPI